MYMYACNNNKKKVIGCIVLLLIDTAEEKVKIIIEIIDFIKSK